MTFTDVQQAHHRQAFIDESRQKAWGAACNADWIGKQLDDLMKQYNKFKADDAALETEIKTLETALDSHTKDNREKRKGLQSRRDILTRAIQALSQNMTQGQRAMHQLYAEAENNLALAKHAEGWSWKEAEAKSGEAAKDI